MKIERKIVGIRKKKFIGEEETVGVERRNSGGGEMPGRDGMSRARARERGKKGRNQTNPCHLLLGVQNTTFYKI